MSTSLGRLTVDMIMRTAGFEQGMTRAERIAQQKSRAIQRQINFMSVGILSAATAAQTFATSLINTAAQSIDATQKMAQQIGVTTEQLTGMRYAAQQFANVSDQTFDMAMRRMTRRIGDAAKGTGAASGALRELGLEARSLAQLSPDQQFKAIADAMSQMQSEGRQLSATMAIFDTQGMPLVNALRQGSGVLDEMQQKAERLGFTLSESDATIITNLNTARDNLTRAYDTITQKAIVGIAPALTEMAESGLAFFEKIENVGEKAAAIFSALNGVLQVTAAIMATRMVAAAASATLAFMAKAGANAIANYQLAQTIGFSRAASVGLTALAVSARGAMVAMSLLGGWVGVLALGVGAAYMAFNSGTKANEDYKKSLEGLTGPMEEVSKRLQQMTIDQRQSSLAAIEASVDAQKKVVSDAIKDLENEIAGAMSGQFMGTSRQFDSFIISLQEAIDNGESLYSLMQDAERQGFISSAAISGVLDFSAALDTQRGKLVEAETRALEVADAIKQIGDSAASAASGVATLSAELLEAMDEGEKYAKGLSDRLITAGLKTETARFDAMIKAGKLAYATEGELLEIRKLAQQYDARTDTSGASKAAAAAKQQADAMKSMLDRLLPAAKITRDYNEDQARLNTALNSGKITADQYTEALKNLNKQRDDSVRNLIPEEIKRMEDLERTATSGILSYIRQQERLLAARGMGENERELAAALGEVEERYRRIAEQMMASPLGISDEELERLKAYKEAEQEILTGYHNKNLALNDSFVDGLQSGMQRYVDSVGSMSSQAADFMMGAFGHVEDALFQLITTGKMDIGALLQSLASDAIRMMIRMGMQMAINFAMAKMFGTASAAAAAVQGATMATAYAPAAAMASLASFGSNAGPAMAGIASTAALSNSLAFAGMFDDGGRIPAGQFGIVGEIGPEIVHGPAMVTSRVDTARALSAAGGNTVVQVIESPERAGQQETDTDGETEFVRIFVADINGDGPMSRTMQSKFGLGMVPR